MNRDPTNHAKPAKRLPDPTPFASGLADRIAETTMVFFRFWGPKTAKNDHKTVIFCQKPGPERPRRKRAKWKNGSKTPSDPAKPVKTGPDPTPECLGLSGQNTGQQKNPKMTKNDKKPKKPSKNRAFLVPVYPGQPRQMNFRTKKTRMAKMQKWQKWQKNRKKPPRECLDESG